MLEIDNLNYIAIDIDIDDFSEYAIIPVLDNKVGSLGQAEFLSRIREEDTLYIASSYW